MKIGSLKRGGRDGTLVVVNRALSQAVSVPDIAPTMQYLMDHWDRCHRQIEAVASGLNDGTESQSFAVSPDDFASPLPRQLSVLRWFCVPFAYGESAQGTRCCDAGGFSIRYRLMYQGLSDRFYAPTDAVLMNNEADEIDLEAEIAVIVDDVPQGTTADAARSHIKLIMLLNDWSLRALTRVEVPRGFGFIQSKPASACSPVAVTPDELGPAWDGRKLSLPLIPSINGECFGRLEAGSDMYFDYPELIAHAARTRALSAGTIIGAGTVSNRNKASGYGCIAEARTDEDLQFGAPHTPFLRFGDVVRIEMLGPDGCSIFGAIEQTIRPV